jgi:molecular chaperone Hsp33
MSSDDKLQRFIFEHQNVRGELVKLQTTYQTILQQRHYPAPVTILLGEALAATALLSATIKYEGSLILQTQATGPVNLLVVQCNHLLQMRALARWHDDAIFNKDLLGDGQLVITVMPDNTLEKYQGVVAISADNLAKSLEAYFLQSEQLPTRLWLASDGETAVGMLLQKMPAPQTGEQAAGDAWGYWEHIEHLANTIKTTELLTLDNQTILHRLFHEEDVRLFEPQSVEFRCQCTKQKMEQALRVMGKAEVQEILAEHPIVEVTCDFCNNAYAFSPQEVEIIFNAGSNEG